MTNPGGKLFLEESGQILKDYSLGVTRVPLEEMGCAPFNRNGEGVSGKHVHTIIKRIVKEQGLVPYRYRAGLALAVNPNDPLAVSRFTNDYVRKQSDMLATVAEKPLHASFAKTHLWHGLWTLKQGGKCFDGTGEPMEVAPGHGDKELAETLRHGMLYEVLRYEAYEKYPQAVEAMMSADNFDHAQGLADTEMTLLVRYFHVGSSVVVPQGMDHFEAVRAKVDKHLGTEWTIAERTSIYNFSKVIGEEQLEAMRLCHQQFVDPKRLHLAPDQLHVLSKLDPELIWAKAAVVIANMIAKVEKQERRGSFYIGAAVTKAELTSLIQVKSAELMPVEAFIRRVLSTYSSEVMAGVTANDILKSQSHFLGKIGEALARSREGEARDVAMALAEKGIRKVLSKASRAPLPDPVSRRLKEMLAKEATDCAPAQSRDAGQSRGVRPDLTPAVKIDDQGGIVCDLALAARKKGILVNARVELTRKVGDRDVGSLGFVTGIGDKVTVAFESQVEDGKKRKLEFVKEDVDLDDLTSVLSKKSKTDCGKAPEAAASVEEKDDRPPGIRWTPVSDEVSMDVQLDALAVAFYNAYVSSSPREDFLRIMWPSKNRVTLNQAVKARCLVLLPFTREVSLTQPTKKSTQSIIAQMKLALQTEWTNVYLLNPGPTKPASGTAVPYWVLQTSKVEDSTLVHSEVELNFPIAASASDKQQKWLKPAKAILQLKLPCLTNPEDLPAKTVLTIPK